MPITKLSPSEVEWVGKQFLDLNFCTFKYSGNFYKAQLPTSLINIETYQDIFAVLNKMDLIPPIHPTNFQMEGFKCILEQYTEPLNVPFAFINWYSIKECAILYIRLCKILHKMNLGLTDGHSQNFIFQNIMEPFWCDIGSIVPIKHIEYAIVFDQFIRHLIYPLLLPQDYDIFCPLRKIFITGIPHSLAFAMGIKLPLKKILFNEFDIAVNILSDIIKNVDFKFSNGKWSQYNADSIMDLETHPDFNSSRIKIFCNIFKAISPKTVIDIGANSGLFSKYMAHTSSVLSIEPDVVAVAKFVDNLRATTEKGHIKIALARIDESYIACKNGTMTRAEMAVALALTHHLYFTENYPWKYIAELLSEHCTKILLTEFMPWGLNISKPLGYIPAEYNINNMIKALEIYFEKVEIISYPWPSDSPTRIFVLCTQKRTTPINDGWGNFTSEKLNPGYALDISQDI